MAAGPSVACLALALVLLPWAAVAMFEDQYAGSSWTQQYIGRVSAATTLTAAERAAAVSSGSVPGALFVGSDEGVLAALSQKSGAILWRRLLTADSHIVALTVDSKAHLAVLTRSPRGHFVSLWHAKKALVSWEMPVECGASATAPSIKILAAEDDSGARTIVVTCGHHATGVSTRDGTTVWHHAAPNDKLVVSMASVKEQALVWYVDGGQLFVLHAGLQSEPVPIAIEGHAVLVAPNGVPVVVDMPSSTSARLRCVDGSCLQSGMLRSSSGSATITSVTSAAGNGMVLIRWSDGFAVTLTVLVDSDAEVAASGAVAGNGKQSVSSFVSQWDFADNGRVFALADNAPRAVAASIEMDDSDTKLRIFTANGSPSLTQVNDVNLKTCGGVSKLFLFPFSKSGGAEGSATEGYRALMITKDDGIHMLSMSRGDTVWRRDEALAHVTKILALDSTKDAAQDELSHAASLSHSADLLKLSFTDRLQLQWQHFKHVGMSLAEAARHALDLKPATLFGAQATVLDESYGMNHTMIIKTRAGKLFGMHAVSGVISWYRLISPDAQVFVTRRRAIAAYEPEIVVVQPAGSNTICEYIAAETGRAVEQLVVEAEFRTLRVVRPIALMDETHRRHLMLVKDSHEVVPVPSTQADLPPTVYWTVNHDTGVIEGRKIVSHGGRLLSTAAWSMVLAPESYKFEAFAQPDPDDVIHMPVRILGDDSLLINYVNPHLLVVAVSSADTSSGASSVTIFVLDSVSGTVLHSRTHNDAAGPVHLLVHENWVTYTYWNTAAPWVELGSLALYEGSIKSLDLNPFKQPKLPTVFSSYHPVDLLVMSRTFVMPEPVTMLGVTRSAAGITNRNLLVGLQSGALWALDRRFVDPRRPMREPTTAEQEEGLMQYHAHLPLMHQSYLSVNQTLPRLAHVHAAPAHLESTMAVLASGLDLFYTRARPSKDFDVLTPEFNRPLLVVLSSALLIATLWLRHMAQSKQLRDAWK